ncbi:MAG: hypothetical protein WC249_03110 [Patescibacteria group bacterium]
MIYLLSLFVGSFQLFVNESQLPADIVSTFSNENKKESKNVSLAFNLAIN